MKVSELRKLTDQELRDRVVEFKKKLMNLRFQNAIGSLGKNSEIGQVKKDIARMLTILKEREIKKS